MKTCVDMTKSCVFFSPDQSYGQCQTKCDRNGRAALFQILRLDPTSSRDSCEWIGVGHRQVSHLGEDLSKAGELRPASSQQNFTNRILWPSVIEVVDRIAQTAALFTRHCLNNVAGARILGLYPIRDTSVAGAGSIR